MPNLFEPFTLAGLELTNRLVMAPLTRNRAGAGEAPTALAAEYYAQRASAGLIIAEGTQPSAAGQAYPHTPGLHTDEQTAGWAQVADAVHARGGKIVVQLMHAGRISHEAIIGTRPVAPSAITPAGQVYTEQGMKDFEEPRALETAELPGVVAEFVDAARRAMAAGLDGVELHAANGYLLQQFLATGANSRTDGYGGTPEYRARFVIEVATAVAAAIGADKVGIRISPAGTMNGISETEVAATYAALLDGLNPLGLLYLHILEGQDTVFHEKLRAQWTGAVIFNTGFTGPSDLGTAQAAVDDGTTDLFCIGRGFLANPDLVERLRSGADLNEVDTTTLYSGGAKGYTDYPLLSA
ncbi:alkene reductase [Pengzhenrongella frigida]|uniref:Alkene reductase n=1 Tax=Pengzhenrongella frigida TaxID=1259133 RepID=A0A4Q5MYY0_9MICO|nr:alkene reductase [Cellulomonas sp. HLT2-17]RYV50915.1 alkene reductase [Cellulomonas sp. HLT2-17]